MMYVRCSDGGSHDPKARALPKRLRKSSPGHHKPRVGDHYGGLCLAYVAQPESTSRGEPSRAGSSSPPGDQGQRDPAYRRVDTRDSSGKVYEHEPCAPRSLGRLRRNPRHFSHTIDDPFTARRRLRVAAELEAQAPDPLASWTSTESGRVSRFLFDHAKEAHFRVEGCGNFSGRSCQRAPLRKIHRIPSSTRRFSIHGRPPLRCLGGLGSKGAIFFHCASVSNGPDRAIGPPSALLTLLISHFRLINHSHFNGFFKVVQQLLVKTRTSARFLVSAASQ